eukprot:SM000196S05384  [mRNA]  locus=s196:170523:173170:- [translate_table: standard]
MAPVDLNLPPEEQEEGRGQANGGGGSGGGGDEPLSPLSSPRQAVESAKDIYARGRLAAGLYLVGTPIGNLEDISMRALRVLRSADLILAEDTRHSAKLLRFYDIATPAVCALQSSLHFGIHCLQMSYHQFNASARRPAAVQRLQRGEALALISDAGMPGISDPGSDLVEACVRGRVPVYPIPGACALVAALVASGLPTREFAFLGFLPEKSGARQRRLATAAAEQATQVLYVAPHKLSATLADCAVTFGPERRAVVAREITKLHEEFWRGSLAEAQAEFGQRNPRGEMTLVIEGLDRHAVAEAEGGAADEQYLEALLAEHMAAGLAPSEASRVVAAETSAKRRAVYTLAVKLAAAARSESDGGA